MLTLPPLATPSQVANCLVGLGPMVWLDAACAGGWRGTLLAMCPEQELTGRIDSPSDRMRLRQMASSGALVLSADPMDPAKQSGVPALADGVVAGFIEFDGRFWFGKFSSLLWHDAERDRWFGCPQLAAAVSRRWAMREGSAAVPALEFEQCTDAREFTTMVQRAQEWIASGDIYQVNLARKYVADWTATADGSELALFQRMRRVCPAPHAGFLDLGRGRRKILSFSPETFLKFDGSEVETRPIKGTRPRGANRQEDQRLATELTACPKERAELIMITDLLRNDLGQVCEFGSVQVPELLQLRKFSHVQHMISTVTGRLRAGLDAWDALAACSPGGSISGAPKRRALEVIAELEKVPRGLYTGSIGWLNPHGRGEFSIAIRSLVIESGQAHFHVGAGLVADSVPQLEFEETCHKAVGLLQACGSPGQGRVSSGRMARAQKSRSSGKAEKRLAEV